MPQAAPQCQLTPPWGTCPGGKVSVPCLAELLRTLGNSSELRGTRPRRAEAFRRAMAPDIALVLRVVSQCRQATPPGTLPSPAANWLCGAELLPEAASVAIATRQRSPR